jgi:nitrogen permease regulator 2-like protein
MHGASQVVSLRLALIFRSYGCLSLVDIFQFNNVYAVTPDIEDIVASPDLQDECVRYVSTGTGGVVEANAQAGAVEKPTFSTLFELYCSLRQGKVLRQWMNERKALLGGIDVRRLISFGVIKGFLYRIHRYPVSLENGNFDKRVNDKRKSLLR